MFFSFDGIDGVGKSTQLELFCDRLRAAGHEVVTCRDPGSTRLGEAVRELVLHADAEVKIDPRSEMLLYMAARAQLVDEIIRPALSAGKVVVSDRYLLANIAYQAYAGGLDIQDVRRVGEVATDGVMPDCVFLLDMDDRAAAGRLGRSLDRMEARGEDYRHRLREGFLAEAARPDSSTYVIDADRPVEQIEIEIWHIATELFESRE